MALTKIGGYGNSNGAEISAFDPGSDRLFVVAGNVVEVLNLSTTASPTKILDLALDTSTLADGFNLVPNSVAVGKAGTASGGIVAVALAVRNSLNNHQPGEVQFFQASTGNFLGKETVGFLPDMITFSPDGTKVLTANEGEPNEDYTVDPEGSISIINLASGVANATVQNATFTAFNAQQAALETAGVRIFGTILNSAGNVVRDSTVAEDLEPEYIAFNGDATKAWVTLQENNAIAVVDIATATVESILPLGYKDHNSVTVKDLETFEFRDLPSIGSTEAGQELFLGGFSGLFYEGEAANGNLKFVTNTDRGPNGEPTGSNRPFLLPEFNPEIVRFELNRATGELTITDRIGLKQADGTTPITGLPNVAVASGTGSTPYNDEVPVDLQGNVITPLDPFGADLEGVVVNPADGSFWMVDEYRPAIYQFNAEGTLLDRFVPVGTGVAAGGNAGDFGTEALPAVIAQRRQNRGFEAVALNTDNNKLYAFVQSPIRNPSTLTNGNLNGLNNIRIVEFDVATETVTAQYLYRMDNGNLGGEPNTRPDKLGDAVYIGNGEFLVVERDDDSLNSGDALNTIEKKVYRFSLAGATNINGQDAPIDQMTPVELSSQGINLVGKVLHVDLTTAGYNTVEKVEGLALVDKDTIAVLNDNDFQVAGITINTATGTFTPDPTPEPVVLGLITTNSNGLDASDRDVNGSSGAGGKINIRNWPVFGMYQPDSIASFTANGETYYVTANEGDTRVRPTGDNLLADTSIDEGDLFNEESRLSGVDLDDTLFPTEATLKLNQNLGRLTVTTASGDIDGDGNLDQIFVPGARSFSIWDSTGNLVYDSGDDFEEITAAAFPAFFNASNDSNSLDNRSDNKGPEPEGVTVGKVGARTYAFIGLERIGGVMVYDVTVPTAPTFVQYLNDRDFTADPETNATDSGPEGLLFIPATDSPNGENLLVVTNEVSQTVSVMSFTPPPFTLELFHLADQEPLNAGAGLTDITGLSAVLNALKAEDVGNDGLADNTLILSSGDAIIPGLFYEASLPAFGSRGIADIQIQNELGVQAIAFGNHEFDFGTKAIADLISGAAPGTILGADFAGANFPYLSTNLGFTNPDFSTNADLAPLEIPGGQAPQANKVTSSTVIEVNGEQIGVVGATTPTLGSISSPGTVRISPSPFGSNPTDAELDALAAIIQTEVDALLAANPDMNKVVLLAHMQKLTIEEALATRLENVDIIVGGGSNTRLFDENDQVRAGDSDQGEYPTFITNAGGTQTAVVNTDGSYKYLGRLVIDFDAAGNIIADSYDPEVSGAYATDAQGVADLDAEGLVDPEVQQIVDAIEEQILLTESNVLGISDVFLNGNRSGTELDGVRTQETNLGNLTADANLAAAKAVDDDVVVSIKNGGGIRASIGQTIVPAGGSEAVRSPNSALLDSEGNEVKPEGGISENDIKKALAFNNNLSLLTLTREELVAVLEHGVAGSGAPGQFPQVAGVKFSFDPDLPANDRLLSAGIFDEEDNLIAELVRDGELVGDPNETFRIVTLGFLADGGDSYPFPTGDAVNRVDLTDLDGNGTDDETSTGGATFAFDGTEQDALAEYLLDNFATAETAFNEEDVTREFDTRIQNLNYREDTVLPEPEIDLEDSDAEKGVIALTSALLLAFQATVTSDSFVNELVIFQVEDSDGNVVDSNGNPISPDAEGYLAAILNASTTQVVLSTLANNQEVDSGLPDDFLSAFGANLNGLTSELLVNSSTRLGFMLVRDGTLDDLEAGNEDLDVFFSTKGQAQLSELTNGGFSLTFGEDGLTFEVSTAEFDTTIEVEEVSRVGRNVLISDATIEAIDLLNLDFDFDGDGTADDLTGRLLNVQITLYREAAFDNLIGFYAANADGSINGVAVTAVNYAQTAFESAITTFSAPSNESTVSVPLENLSAGTLILPFIISNSDTPASDFSNVYFPFLSLNADGADHIRLLGQGVFGFEDLAGGGDQDFDDIIAQITAVNV